jgi:hypothetical protein
MTLVTFNVLMAGVIALVAIGSIGAMNGATSNAVRMAVLMIMVGAGGQVIGWAATQWDNYLDTILYGGVLTLLVSTRRGPVLASPAWASRLSLAIVAVTLAAVLFYLALE